MNGEFFDGSDSEECLCEDGESETKMNTDMQRPGYSEAGWYDGQGPIG